MAFVPRAASNAIINPVVQLINDVMNKEDHHQILQIDLERMEIFLQDIGLFRDQHQAPPEIVKIWLQLLHNSLVEAKRLLHPLGRRQRCLDFVVNNPRRPSKQIGAWNAFFDHLYHSFQRQMSILVTSLQYVSTKPLHKEEALPQHVAASGFVGSGIRDAQAQVERWLNEGDRVHLIGVYGIPGVGKTSLLRLVCDKHKKVRDVFEKVIWIRIYENYKISDLKSAIEDQIHRSWDETQMELSAYLKEYKFLLVLDDLWSPLDLQELGVVFGDGKHSKVLFSTQRKDLIGEMGAEESIEIQPLPTDEGWMLFRRVAFKDDPVSMEIQERAKRFADQYKSVPLAINIVAAMIGQTSVDEWDTYFSLLQKVDPSFPATHSGLDAQLYALIRLSYDTLPNSNVKNCFLYCAMYKQDQAIDSRQLVHMWIGEGLVKSKQGTYLMDMAIGRSYLKLLVDRCLFLIVKESTNIFRRSSTHLHDVFPSIRVHDIIRDAAMFIGDKEEKSMASQNLRNFPEHHDETCRRISFPDNDNGDLPTNLRCPKLASLIFEGNRYLKELPSEFVLSLTSLRVLNLSGCTKMTSVPTSVGQLRLLEFLSLSGLPVEDLGEEVCTLSELQFLDLSCCGSLKSLPSQIGELKKLKYLNLEVCYMLKMIPREMCELTSLSRLQLYTCLNVETEAPASIWSLKGLKTLTDLQICVRAWERGLRIEEGIMGTWSEMRHLVLYYTFDLQYDIREDLPRDIHNMKKLQSFTLFWYRGLNLPKCRFEYLEMVKLRYCDYIRDLSPLERLPNLKHLTLERLPNLRELGIGSLGRVPSGYLKLEKLVLKYLRLESLAGPSNTGVWDEKTLPQLRVLKIVHCYALQRFPVGMEKLQNLCSLEGNLWWWDWIDDNMKFKFQKIFVPCEDEKPFYIPAEHRYDNRYN